MFNFRTSQTHHRYITENKFNYPAHITPNFYYYQSLEQKKKKKLFYFHRRVWGEGELCSSELKLPPLHPTHQRQPIISKTFKILSKKLISKRKDSASFWNIFQIFKLFKFVQNTYIIPFMKFDFSSTSIADIQQKQQ